MKRTRRAGRARREGMTLIEIMVVIVIMAMIATAVGVQVLAAWDRAKQQRALTDAMTIKSVAQQYLMHHTSADCPTVDELLEDGLLDEDTAHADPWDHAFEIACDGSRIHVRSAGPDGRFDTEDDIAGRAQH